MKFALKLAAKGMGFTEPNPMVGAVAVKNGRIMAAGYHHRFGTDHAERDALNHIDEPGATLYVTLEPCTHFGKTPPCVDFLLEKKVNRVVTAMQDPNPLVNGQGIRKLEENGIHVDAGILEDMARKLNRHYIKYMTSHMPYVTLKAGVSLDGKFTDKFRKSQWITDEEMRRFSHSLRGEFSAIMVGKQTAIDDDPLLNIREQAWGDKKLYRVVLDTHNRLDTRLRIFGGDQEQYPLAIFSSQEAENRTLKVKHHFFVRPCSETGKGIDLREVLSVLYQMGIASVMVEGGGTLFNSFLQEKLYDEIILAAAGTFIGGEESVQLFRQGTSVTTPIELKEREITVLKAGYFIRGYK
ncbi:MAG: bifunctional diaminohydroxyphosphoribosylaminopyrimidine deaminase/5-amino-6-(5-phosphoribosylamino)uracil reductase RibD [Acidobacteria bacterium]|nr:bifunctional diaminohydroxyphosphoribosylaminopyrimidine deaminase/5-amino-6-(5-phosphoribosylamino)uracil reductase RibD [Acidobacteriota bacterium]